MLYVLYDSARSSAVGCFVVVGVVYGESRKGEPCSAKMPASCIVLFFIGEGMYFGHERIKISYLRQSSTNYLENRYKYTIYNVKCKIQRLKDACWRLHFHAEE